MNRVHRKIIPPGIVTCAKYECIKTNMAMKRIRIDRWSNDTSFFDTFCIGIKFVFVVGKKSKTKKKILYPKIYSSLIFSPIFYTNLIVCRNLSVHPLPLQVFKIMAPGWIILLFRFYFFFHSIPFPFKSNCTNILSFYFILSNFYFKNKLIYQQK